MEITPEQAVDITVNLCGGKLRSKLSAEKDAQHAQAEKRAEEPDIDDALEQLPGEEEKDDDEEVYYYDLVQLMSLLLIGELVELADRHERISDVGFSKDLDSGALKLGTEKGGIFDVVIKSITEVFDEKVQKNILNGRRTLDKDMLAMMLEAFGDVDAANDDLLLMQMLEALGGVGTPLTTETFMRALTADVKTYSSQKATSKSTSMEAPIYTSTFFDVYGRNWEGGGDPDKKGVMGQAPAPIKTASFIDYAADTYGSVVLNTAVWSLFLLTSEYTGCVASVVAS